MIECPKISIWVTSCGRSQYLPLALESFIDNCRYPNYEILLIESLMTEESKKFFTTKYIHEEENLEYINRLEDRFRHVKFKIMVQPYKPLGQVYDQLLSMTGDYYFNIEDDNKTYCDPTPQFLDHIHLLDNDPLLLGMRTDLRDETVYEGCPRFPTTKSIDGHKYVIYGDWCSGGLQVMDARKVRAIGGFCTTHAPNDYIMTEKDQSAKMRDAKMHIGISLKWWGFTACFGIFGVQGGDRSGTLGHCEELAAYGWVGDGSNRREKPHTLQYWQGRRRNNGRP